jgi:hypothetical protein
VSFVGLEPVSEYEPENPDHSSIITTANAGDVPPSDIVAVIVDGAFVSSAVEKNVAQ